MISVPRPLLYLPSLELDAQGVTAVELSTNANSPNTKSITIKQKPQGGELIDSDLQETNFDVYVPDMFLTITNGQVVGSPDVNKIALYNISAATGTDYPTLNLTLSVRTITDSTFQVYSRSVTSGSTPQRVINTSIKIVGKTSGAVLDLPVRITRTL